MSNLIPDALRHLPQPRDKRLALRLSPKAERAIRKGHPWLYAEGIREGEENGRSGDLGVIFDKKRRFVAIGLYDPHSPIRLRVLQRGKPAQINADWFRDRLAKAAKLRRPLHEANTNGYRLVYGENDGLPGVVIDRYATTYVMKLYSAAWVPHLRDVVAGLTAVMPLERLVLRLSRHVQKQTERLYGLSDGQTLIGGEPTEPIRFRENGLHFEADVLAGQKTGFFLDQRDNRARVEAAAEGKRVLNVFSYTGGFSLYPARGGATEVVSLDLSQPALAGAVRNFGLNEGQAGVSKADHELLLGDAFRSLKQLRRTGRKFDMVVIDPPAFAKQQSEVERALTAYGKLVRRGLGVLRPGGMLVMASCSSRVTSDDFFRMVHRTALKAKRPLREIQRTGHALDHPVTFKEGAYLKCLFAIAP